MKKLFVMAVLGLVVRSASAQGSIAFNSYLANNSNGIPIYFPPGYFVSGPVGAGYTADLLWSLNPITEAASNGFLNNGWLLSGSGAPSVHSVAIPFATPGIPPGYFAGTNNFILNPYAPGTLVYFEVIFYQTAAGSYQNSIVRGHSAAFSATLATGLQLPQPINFPSFFVVPEPGTLTLTALGGLVSLLARRRQRT
jgi:hypothetical protein